MTSGGRVGSALRVAAYAVGVVGGLIGLVVVLPRVSGASWTAVAHVVQALPPWALAVLPALWLGGLVAHTLTLSAALPGLSHRRALVLSLTGSAVANVLPLGGAAGVALNYRMTRRWGFAPAGFAAYTVVTNLCDVLAKLTLPLALLPLVALGLPTGPGLGRAITAAAVALPALAGLAAVVVAAPRLLGRLGRLGARVERVRSTVRGLLVTAWGRLSAGMVLYTALLLVLLTTCLTLTHAAVALPVVVLGFCAERLATLVPVTPGGLGLVEVGLAGALLLSPGADPAGVAAGVLLYRTLTFGLEIPVGGVLLAGWTWRTRAVAA